jgi:hypothetical protein
MSKNNHQSVNFWLFLQNVLRRSMDKGQFPMAIVGIIVISMIWKMPSEDVSKLAFEMLSKVEKGQLTGWISALLSLTGWYVHIRVQRKTASDEVARVANEKTKYQASALGEKVESSEK